MRDETRIIDQVKDRQRRMFRIALDPVRHGLTLKIIAADAGLTYDSVRNYASGETAMPLAALVALIGVLPDELLSLLLPEGVNITHAVEGECHDTMAVHCVDFAGAHARARHPDSPGGVKIVREEHETLSAKASAIRGK